MSLTAADVLAFWFGPPPHATRDAWFRKDPAFDATIRERFGERRRCRSRRRFPRLAGEPSRRARTGDPARPVHPQHLPRHAAGVRRRCAGARHRPGRHRPGLRPHSSTPTSAGSCTCRSSTPRTGPCSSVRWPCSHNSPPTPVTARRCNGPKSTPRSSAASAATRTATQSWAAHRHPRKSLSSPSPARLSKRPALTRAVLPALMSNGHGSRSGKRSQPDRPDPRTTAALRAASAASSHDASGWQPRLPATQPAESNSPRRNDAEPLATPATVHNAQFTASTHECTQPFTQLPHLTLRIHAAPTRRRAEDESHGNRSVRDVHECGDGRVPAVRRELLVTATAT